MKQFIVLLVSVVALCSGLPRIVKRESTPFAYELPSNASVVVGNIVTGFECVGRQYGYYADQNNNCQIFHVCLPYPGDNGVEESRMWSFICGEGTIFDQSQLLCNYPEYALPCEEAANMYNINDYFRQENQEREFRDGLNDIF